jgi:glutamate-1-semialdehyde 2,1-aminomutase
MKYQRSSQLFVEAQNYIPGGVNSPVRAFKGVGGTPIFIKKAEGAYLHSEDGHKYVDYINSWGPMILGHNFPKVKEAMQLQLENGTCFGTPTELETEIAKLIVENVQNIDKIRFVSSGTEACMSAIRLARGYTKKDKIIKFEGCYHGHADSFLIKAGSGASTFGSPNSLGVTKGTANDTLIAKYNNLETVAELFKQNPDQIAGIILEPVAGNMGCIAPKQGFLQGLRKLCDENNALLIFDEVMTGFRLSFGGVQELFGIKADLVTYGKIIGGGMPVGAFGGRKEIMDFLSPLGGVYQAGTLSGNPISLAAGLATLKELLENKNIYDAIDLTTQQLDKEISSILHQKGIPFKTNRLESMFSVFFTETEVIDFETATTANNKTFNRFFHHLLANEIYLPPSSFETWFISNAIKQPEIEKTLNAIKSF